jgi:hypothetical protein
MTLAYAPDFARLVNQFRKESLNVITEKVVKNVAHSHVLHLLVEAFSLESKRFNRSFSYAACSD